MLMQQQQLNYYYLYVLKKQINDLPIFSLQLVSSVKTNLFQINVPLEILIFQEFIFKLYTTVN